VKGYHRAENIIKLSLVGRSKDEFQRELHDPRIARKTRDLSELPAGDIIIRKE
jgi:hypothetical protein